MKQSCWLKCIACCFMLAWVDGVVVAHEEPKLYALLVGISDYRTGQLPHAERGLTAMQRLLQESYPSMCVRVLADGKGSVQSIREALDHVRALPDQSFFVFYFAGHGDRGNGRGPLMLRLSGSWGPGDRTNCIGIEEIVGVLRDAKRLNAMVFVDSCFSGEPPRPLDLDEFEYAHLGHRVFMLTSSASTDMSEKGLFTLALEEVWNDGADACLTPRELEKRVRSKVWHDSKGYMVPQLAFDTVVTRCISQLGQPAAHVVFKYSHPIRYQTTYEMSAVPNELFLHQYQPSRDPVFSVQVTAESQTVTVYCRGKTLAEIELTEERLRDGVEVICIEVPEELRISGAEYANAYSDAMTFSIFQALGRPENELIELAASGLSALPAGEGALRIDVAFGLAVEYVRIADEAEIRAFGKEHPSALMVLLGVLQRVGRHNLVLSMTNEIPEEIAEVSDLYQIALLHRGFAAAVTGADEVRDAVSEKMDPAILEVLFELERELRIRPEYAASLVPIQIPRQGFDEENIDLERERERSSITRLNEYLNPREKLPDALSDPLGVLEDAASRERYWYLP